MWYNEERPHDFDHVKGQDEIVKGIRNQSIKDKFFQIYIFGGQYGGGKTTMARIVSLAVNCKHKDANGNPCLVCPECQAILKGSCADVIEMDGASNTGVDDVRNLKDSMNYLPSEVSKKVYIIDEVHMLSKGAFNALLKMLEEPPKHVIIILCTTDVKMIPDTVKSRAAKYTFLPIEQAVIKKRILEIAESHSIVLEDMAAHLIAKNSHGSMRDSISLLEQASEQAEGAIKEETIKEMLGITDPTQLFLLLRALLVANMSVILDSMEKLIKLGKEPFLMVSDLLDILTDCVIAHFQGADEVGNTQQYVAEVKEIAMSTDVECFYSLMNGLMSVREELRQMPGKTTLICGVIRIMSDEQGAYVKMAQKVANLERTIQQLVAGKLEMSEVDVVDKQNPERIESVVEVASTETVDEQTTMQAEPVEEVASTETVDEQTAPFYVDTEDPNAMMNLFSIFTIEAVTTQSKSEIVVEEPMENKESQSTNIDDYLLGLYTDNVIENALEIGCNRSVNENGETVFTTQCKEIYRIIKAYDAVKNFPFKYMLNGN